jgi:uncharacterized protein
MHNYKRNENDESGQSVLITGGSGLIGRYLTSLLLAGGYKVSHLSRQTNDLGKVRVYRWDPAKEYLDPQAFVGIDYLVHLSGANLGEKRWTASRKEEIRCSRIDAANLLFRTVSENNHKLKAFITASATGYYGSATSDKIFIEEDLPGEDFLGKTCRLWEEGADHFAEMGIRTVKIRSAVVLEKSDSVLSRLMKPARFGLVIRLGDGRQFFPWIHITDLCNIYMKAIMDESLHGAYNAVAPENADHNEFVRRMAGVMHRPVFLPMVPAWVVKAVLGEMSDIVLKGSRISADRIIKAGYTFCFDNLEAALTNIIRG